MTTRLALSMLVIGAAAAAVVMGAGQAHAYQLPVRGDSLGSGEMFDTFVHVSGIQAEGKDILAHRHIADNKWSMLKADGADPKVLTSYVDYGKPVYAMAAGTVVGCWRNAPQNVPGSYNPAYVASLIPGSGNHVWILQDDGVYALYAHMQPGSIPAALCPHADPLMSSTVEDVGSSPNILPVTVVSGGARVAAGQQLGLLGNSGASKQLPHLHVHMEKGGKPVVMTFARGMTEPFPGQATGSLDGPWTRLAGQAMPKATILLWPPHPIGSFTFNATKAADYQGLFDHLNDSGLMPDAVSCAANGATYSTGWIPAKGSWVSYAGMSALAAVIKQGQLTAQGYTRTSFANCGTVSIGVWRK